MKKPLAVIDTNVLVAAFLSSRNDSAVVRVLEKIVHYEVLPLYTDEIIKEYREVLSRKKFSLDEEAVQYIVSVMINRGIAVDPKPSEIQLIDSKDLVFYEVVLEKKDDGAYLVTGNKKHFPNDPIVVTAAEFLQIVESREDQPIDANHRIIGK